MKDDRSLEEIQRSLGDRAESEFRAAPAATAIACMIDFRNGHSGAASPQFMAGYDQAIHDATMIYLQSTDTVTCGCDAINASYYRHPEQLADGTWHCATCEETLAENTRDAVDNEP